MKAEIGYIKAWRLSMFFAAIIDIIIFGLGSTIASARVGGIAANMMSVMILIICIIIFILVYTDKADRFRDIGAAEISDGVLIYEDRKRHYKIPVSDIKKIDMEKICMGRYDGPPTAYRILLATDKKKYYIESDRAMGRNYNEMGINDIYMYIAEVVNR